MNRPRTLTRMLAVSGLALLLFAAPEWASAQDVVPAPETPPSPRAIAQANLGDTYLLIHYGSPRKRDRDIFPGLQAFGEVWRTGANEATEFLTTSDIEVAGQPLAAGIYSVHSIPGEETWTVIFNSAVGEWGTQYDESQDVLRVEVPTDMSGPIHEALTIAFEEQSEGTALTIAWDDVMVSVPIKAASL